MSDMDAKVGTTYEFGGSLRGADGFTIEFECDDSFHSWWQIVRWNWHFRHWSALRMNARDLFTKVIGRKLWRR